MIYKHILLATELANENRNLENKAVQLQQLTQAKISIISVVEFLPSDYMGAEMGALALDIESEESMMNHAKLALDRVADRLKISDKNRILEDGRAADKIVDTANNIDADLIIVGSHGRHGLQLLLGSTANSVLHHAKCDVIAVRLQNND